MSLSVAAKTMGTRLLGSGKSGLRVSRQGFGCMSLTAFYGAALPEEEALSVLQAAYDSGVTHFDTAQVYVGRDARGKLRSNEALLGKFVERVGAGNVTIATKFYPRRNDKGEFMFSEEMFWAALNQSLKRLRVASVDLYYLHRLYPQGCVSIEEWMRLMKAAIRCGKVRCCGLSEASPRIIQRAHAVYPLTAVQQEWSLVARDLENEIVPTCRELDIGIVSYSPVARGLLAGAFKGAASAPKDWRNTVPYLRAENLDANAQVVSQLERIAAEKRCSVSQLCIAWVEAHGAVPIPGTTKIDHVHDNVGATRVEISTGDMERLNTLALQIRGERGGKDYMENSFHAHL